MWRKITLATYVVNPVIALSLRGGCVPSADTFLRGAIQH